MVVIDKVANGYRVEVPMGRPRRPRANSLLGHDFKQIVRETQKIQEEDPLLSKLRDDAEEVKEDEIMEEDRPYEIQIRSNPGVYFFKEYKEVLEFISKLEEAFENAEQGSGSKYGPHLLD